MERGLSVRGNREIQNNYRENYSVQEIAERIVHDSQYEADLQNGYDQVAEKTNGLWKLYGVNRNGMVNKGDEIGYKANYGKRVTIHASHTGIYKCILSEYQLSYTICLYNGSVTFGKIYLPEFNFYKNNQLQIEREVARIRKEKQQAIEIEEQAKKDDAQRKADKLLKDQKDSIDDIDDLLKDLDKYILDNKLPVIETLQEINNDLKVLYAQKDNLNDIKSIKDYKSHFENAYKEAKKNSELTDIIEQRMLDILRTFFEILGESKDSINTKISEIKTAGNDKKFAVEFDEKLTILNESITKLQSTFTNDKKLDFVQLETIEKISIDFEKLRKRINQRKSLERSKDCIESIYIEYIKESKDSSAEKLLKRVLKNFYLIFEKSEQQINERFEKIKEIETIKSFSEKIRELEIIIENNKPVKIELLQTLEDLIKELVKQKDIIQDKAEIENLKVHFDAIFKDCKKRKDFSNSASLRMQEIEKGFNEIIGKKKNFLSVIFGK